LLLPALAGGAGVSAAGGGTACAAGGVGFCVRSLTADDGVAAVLSGADAGAEGDADVGGDGAVAAAGVADVAVVAVALFGAADLSWSCFSSAFGAGDTSNAAVE
jgi:hypothetical protein